MDPEPSDDEPVVLLEERARPKGAAKARYGETPEQALTAATDNRKLSQTVVFNNTTRMQLAKRRANCILFPRTEEERADWRSKPMKSDPPEFRVLFALQEVVHAAASLDDPAEALRIKCKALTEMKNALASIAAEVGDGGDQARKILTDERKFQLEQDKLDRSKGDGLDAAELERIINGSTGK